MRSRPHLPNFIGVGPTRTGSTWLHGVLMRRACLPAHVKETWFFDRYYEKGLNWYQSLFNDCSSPLVGEIGPTYFASPLARGRIAHDLPQCKILCVLRNPAERAYSWFRMQRRIRAIRDSFEATLTTNTDPQLHEANRYARRICEWRESFGVENVGVFFYDDLLANPQAFTDAVTRFLGCGSVPLTPQLLRHLIKNEATRDCRNPTIAYAGHRLRRWLWSHRQGALVNRLDRYGLWRFCFGGGVIFAPLGTATDRSLRTAYRSEIEELESLCNRDLSAWK